MNFYTFLTIFEISNIRKKSIKIFEYGLKLLSFVSNLNFYTFLTSFEFSNIRKKLLKNFENGLKVLMYVSEYFKTIIYGYFEDEISIRLCSNFRKLKRQI